MKKKIFGLEKNVFVLGLVSLFNDLSSEMILSIFPAFFAGVLKAGAASLGLVEGVADAASNFIKIYSGRLSDKIQRRKIFVVWGYVISILTRPFYALASSVLPVLGLRLADRVGKGLRDAPRDAIISLSTGKDSTGRAFGYQRAMDTIGGILGPLVAFFILSAFPNAFNKVFIIAFLAGLLAVAALYFIKDIKIIFSKNQLNGADGQKFSRRFKSYLFSVLLLSVGSLPLAVMLLKIKDAGLLLATIPLFYSVSNISYAGFSLLAGRVADAFGHRKIIIGGYFFLILSYAALYFSGSAGGLVLAFILYGIFLGFTDGIQRSYAAKLTEETARGRAYGYLNGLNGLGLLAAGVLGGLVWEKLGAETALLIGGAIVLLGLISFTMTQLVFKNHFSR